MDRGADGSVMSVGGSSRSSAQNTGRSVASSGTGSTTASGTSSASGSSHVFKRVRAARSTADACSGFPVTAARYPSRASW